MKILISNDGKEKKNSFTARLKDDLYLDDYFTGYGATSDEAKRNLWAQLLMKKERISNIINNFFILEIVKVKENEQ